MANARRRTWATSLMFVVAAIPLIDVRTFLPEPSGRTGAIYWPDPPYGDEFVRGVGGLRPRPRRGVTPWIGEGHFLDLRRGVRFPPAGTVVHEGSRLKPIYRRYFSDGVTGRAELAFDSLEYNPDSVGAEALAYPVRLAASPDTPIAFGASGGRLASMLLRATTRAARLRDVQDWWVTAGSPVTATRDVKPVDDAGDQWALLQRWTPAPNGRASHWTLSRPLNRQTWLEERQLRVHVLRLHTGIEGLRTVLRLCRTNKLQVQDNDELQDYLETRVDFLLRRRFGGYDQRGLMEHTLDAFGTGYADELTTIEQTYSQVSRGLARKLERLANILGAASGGAEGQPRILIMTGGTLTDNSVNISGGNVGAAQGGTGNVQTINALNQAITQGDNAGEILSKVLQFVSSLRGQGLDEATVAEGEDLAEAARNEATKEQPDKSKLGRWLDRLKGWAEKVGEVAGPVLTAVGAVAKLIA